MVPGAEARGLVAPRMERPVLTASRPSQTMAQMGPEPMSLEDVSRAYGAGGAELATYRQSGR
jgi:hypothetical protein